MKKKAEIGVMFLQVRGHRGLPVAARSQKGGTGQILPHSIQRNQLCQPFDFEFPVFKTMREYISVVLSHPVCGIFLWQPQEMNIPGPSW